MTEVENWEAVMECPGCNHQIVIHIDRTYPGGRLGCMDCDEDYRMTEVPL